MNHENTIASAVAAKVQIGETELTIEKHDNKYLLKVGEIILPNIIDYKISSFASGDTELEIRLRFNAKLMSTRLKE